MARAPFTAFALSIAATATELRVLREQSSQSLFDASSHSQ